MGRFRDGFTSTGASAGLLALVLAGSGTAVAAQSGMVGSPDIKNHSIRSVDLSKGAVTGPAIADGTITGLDVKDGSLYGADIHDGGLSGKKLAADTVRGAQIDESTLGEVPRSHTAEHALTASTVNGVRTSMVQDKITDCGSKTQPSDLVEPGFTIQVACTRGGNPYLQYDAIITTDDDARGTATLHTLDANSDTTDEDEHTTPSNPYLYLVSNDDAARLNVNGTTWGEANVTAADGETTFVRFATFVQYDFDNPDDNTTDFEVTLEISHLT